MHLEMHPNLKNSLEKKAALFAALIKLGAQEGTRTPTKLLAST
jgi:hypothetical protein